jgi:hypothetical protein
MKYNAQLSDSDILRGLKIICIALPAGVILFSVIAISLGSDGPSTMDASSLIVLRIAHLIVTVAAVLGQKYLFEKILEGKSSAKIWGSGSQSLISRYRAATIVKLAIMEGSALLGLVIIMIASIGGFLKTDITLYLHLIPVLLLIGTAQSSYPSEQKMADLSRLYPDQAVI